MNPKGALEAFEFSDTLTLSSFSLPDVLYQTSKKTHDLSIEAVSFLLNSFSSLNGLCALNWGEKYSWADLVEGLIMTPGKASLMPNDQLALFNAQATAQVFADKNPVNAICDTPCLVMMLFIRWLRMDLLDLQKSFTNLLRKQTES